MKLSATDPIVPVSRHRSPVQVLIRVDGNETIGMGHLMRCLTLAQELCAEGFARVGFVTRAHGPSVAVGESCGFPFRFVPPDLSLKEEEQILREQIAAQGTSLMITDLRSVEPAYWAGLKETGAVVAVIDEWGNKEVPADIVINGTAVPAWHRYATQASTQVYAGPRYALLDRSFTAAHALHRQIRENPTCLLVALGGDDPFHLTVKVMESLDLISGILEVTVVIGPAFIDEERIHQAARKSRHRYTLLKNIRNMAELMCRADGALVGGGLTALEAACAGAPALIVCEVDHQVETAAALEEAGCAVNGGLGALASLNGIAQRVSALLKDRARRIALSQAGKKLVDGRGIERVKGILMRTLPARMEHG